MSSVLLLTVNVAALVVSANRQSSPAASERRSGRNPEIAVLRICVSLLPGTCGKSGNDGGFTFLPCLPVGAVFNGCRDRGRRMRLRRSRLRPLQARSARRAGDTMIDRDRQRIVRGLSARLGACQRRSIRALPPRPNAYRLQGATPADPGFHRFPGPAISAQEICPMEDAA